MKIILLTIIFINIAMVPGCISILWPLESKPLLTAIKVTPVKISRSTSTNKMGTKKFDRLRVFLERYDGGAPISISDSVGLDAPGPFEVGTPQVLYFASEDVEGFQRRSYSFTPRKGGQFQYSKVIVASLWFIPAFLFFLLYRKVVKDRAESKYIRSARGDRNARRRKRIS